MCVRMCGYSNSRPVPKSNLTMRAEMCNYFLSLLLPQLITNLAASQQMSLILWDTGKIMQITNLSVCWGTQDTIAWESLCTMCTLNLIPPFNLHHFLIHRIQFHPNHKHYLKSIKKQLLAASLWRHIFKREGCTVAVFFLATHFEHLLQL